MSLAGVGKKNNIGVNVFFIVFSLMFIIPIILIFSISITSDSSISANGYTIFPKEIDFAAYKYIFKNPGTLIQAYKVTMIMSFVGTGLYVFLASMCAYPLSRLDFIYRKQITFYLFFTMLFSGGLVPIYILMTQYLHLKDTYAVLIIAGFGNVWYLLLMRTFFQQIPKSLYESAKIDGANDFRIYFSIMLPLSKPVLATVSLLILLMYWNSWFPVLLYIDDPKMYTLQYMLQVIIRNIQEILRNMQDNLGFGVDNIRDIPRENTRMAMCFVAAGPMMFVFPFFQKYFVKGLTVGSVKG